MGRLSVRDLAIDFGGVRAIQNVSLDIQEGIISSIIGPNGAGKTSLLNCVSGFYHPTEGQILFDGRDITGMSPHEVTNLGISRTFQNIELFSNLSILDNLMLARHSHLKYGFVAGSLFLSKAAQIEAKNRAVVEEIIEFMELQSFRDHRVSSLSYGLQKRVELARALTMKPEILLLDEPMSGMNFEEKEEMVRFVLSIQQARGVTVVLIEHDMSVVMDISEKVFVMDFGRLIAEGAPEAVQNDPEVLKVYLGSS